MAPRKSIKQQKKSHLQAVSAAPAEPKVETVTRVEYLELENAELNYRAAMAEAQNLSVQRTSYLQQIDPENKLGRYEEAIRARQQTAIDAREAGNRVRVAIEARVGFSLDGCSIDDKTLAIHRPNPGAVNVES